MLLLYRRTRSLVTIRPISLSERRCAYCDGKRREQQIRWQVNEAACSTPTDRPIRLRERSTRSRRRTQQRQVQYLRISSIDCLWRLPEVA
jgi:hypothetical protein